MPKEVTHGSLQPSVASLDKLLRMHVLIRPLLKPASTSSWGGKYRASPYLAPRELPDVLQYEKTSLPSCQTPRRDIPGYIMSMPRFKVDSVMVMPTLVLILSTVHIQQLSGIYVPFNAFFGSTTDLVSIMRGVRREQMLHGNGKNSARKALARASCSSSQHVTGELALRDVEMCKNYWGMGYVELLHGCHGLAGTDRIPPTFQNSPVLCQIF